MNEDILTGDSVNIVAVWHRATKQAHFEGDDWYTDAQVICAELAEEFGCTLADAAGVLAVLSPQLDWESNIVAAREFFELGRAHQQTNANNDKAMRAVWGDHDAIRGRKVRAFWQAVVEPYGDSAPVIDRHAVAVYCGHPVSDRDRHRWLDRKDVIPRIQAAYLVAAKQLSEPVHVLQAVTWVQWRIEQAA